jgi:alanine-glyoxylate transaminase/(R)-3-amino-2-methylpropionate-pyruvate transaminase
MATAVSTTPTLPPCDHRPRPYAGPAKDEVLALRKQFLNPTIFTYYAKPLMIVEGHMQYLYDETGRRYLDGFGGIVTVSVGHCHPKIVAAVNRQNEILQHTTTSTHGTSPAGCPATSRSATSSTPAPRPTTSQS